MAVNSAIASEILSVFERLSSHLDTIVRLLKMGQEIQARLQL